MKLSFTLAMISVLATTLSAQSQETQEQPTRSLSRGGPSTGDTPVVTSLATTPINFIENRGQVDRQVAYYIQGSNKTLYFTSRGVTLVLTGKSRRGNTEEDDPPQEAPDRWTVKLDFAGCNPGVRPRGEDRRDTVFSYFKGRPEDWKTNVPCYGKLVYRDLWPGIDLIYSGTAQKLKYEFVVRPGADPDQIRLAYRGVGDLSIRDSGEMVISTPVATFSDGKPYAYQRMSGEEVEVAMAYALDQGPQPCDKAPASTPTYGFKIGPYDPSQPLVLDPVILVYCGYIGGGNQDRGHSITRDSQGRVYVVGDTASPNFPVRVGPFLDHSGDIDLFVAKLKAYPDDPDPAMNFEYCGFIGGEGDDEGWDIAVDSDGWAYVTGFTNSHSPQNTPPGTFPVLLGPDKSYNGGAYDAFVAKIRPGGSGMEYCGYIGGDGIDRAYGIAVDSEGRAYVAGRTASYPDTFPATCGPDLYFNGETDAFVAKVRAVPSDQNEPRNNFQYCGYIGGTDKDGGLDIAVDVDGNAYVIGWTESDDYNERFSALVVGPDLTYNGHTDAFIAKVKADPCVAPGDPDYPKVNFHYCGYIGGDNRDRGYGIAIESDGTAYVTGRTESTQITFPAVVGPDLTHNGNEDAFVAKLKAVPDHTTPTENYFYCGYIGGSNLDRGKDIAVVAGHAAVVGYTESDDFPAVIGPDLSFNGEAGTADAFVARLHVNPDNADPLNNFGWCGFIGGTGDPFGGDDYGEGIAVSPSGAMFVTGYTDSDVTNHDFPVVGGPDLEYNGGTDAFVAMVARSLDPNPWDVPIGGGSVTFALNAGPENAGRTYVLLGSLSGTSPGLPLPGGLVTLPINWDSFTYTVMVFLNSPAFQNFMGVLDESGGATAVFDTQGPLPPVLLGFTFSFAYALNKPWDFASDPVNIEIVK